MFLNGNSELISYTGRWHILPTSATTTTAGAYLDIGFVGETICFHFDVCDTTKDVAHLYISVDGGAQIESAVIPFLRVNTQGGRHTLRLTLKSLSEFHDRWHAPESKVSLLGIEGEDFFAVPEDTRPIIEFVGDSITEGVAVDEIPHPVYDHFCKDRVFQDDSTATYAYLTAQALGMKPYIMGYGAVGVTKGGCGNVPAAPDAYPFCYEGAPIPQYEPKVIVLNHGTNDGGASDELFLEQYTKMLEVLATTHPEAEIVSLSPFYGKKDAIVQKSVEAYNLCHEKKVLCILSTGWIPPTPIHPDREGHRIVAAELTQRIKDYLGL